MRTLLKITIPVESGNKAIKDGSLPATMTLLTETLQPEANYFYPENGQRTAIFVFDMKDSNQIPVIVEPLFINLNAKVELYPVMNSVDLKIGLDQVVKNVNKVPVAA